MGIALGSPIEQAVARGRALYEADHYDSARAVLSPALEEARGTGDLVHQAKILTILGLAAYREDDYAEARQRHEAALDIKLAADLADELASSYNGLGLIAWNEGRLGEAQRLFTESADAAQAARDSVALAVASSNLGLVSADLGDFASARRGMQLMRDVGRRLDDPRREGTGLANLGMLSVWIGDPAGAVPALTEARRLFQLADFRFGEQNVLGQLGTAYAAMGDHGRAVAVLDTALTLSRRLGLRREEASNLEAIARVYADAGDPHNALRLYDRAQELNEVLGLRGELGANIREVAAIHASFDNMPLAVENGRRALSIHREIGAQWEELADLVFLVDLEVDAGHADSAAHRLREARRVAGAIDVRVARLDVALAEARFAHATGDADRVHHALLAAGDDIAKGGYGVEWQADALRARAFAAAGKIDSAIAAGRRAVRAIERVRDGITSGHLRTSYVAERKSVYSDLVAALLEQGRTAGAFEVSDAARRRVLLEQLVATAGNHPDDARPRLAESESQLRRIATLVEQIEWLEDTPPPERSPEIIDELSMLMARLSDARSEYEAHMVRAAEVDPRGATLLGARSISTSDIQATLDSGDVLIEYLVSERAAHAFAVSSTQITAVTLPITARNLASRVRLVRELLRTPDAEPRDVARALARAYDALIRPLDSTGVIARANRLIIVPDGMTAYLPFAALRNADTDRYLVQEAAVSYAPSAAAISVMGGRASDLTRARVAAFAPTPGELPGSRREVRAIRNVFEGRAHHGSDASEGAVREALGSTRIVHLASHGILNVRNPMFSRVLLAPRRNESAGDDGRLEVHEILGLDVESPLVFLSGCETGLGTAWSTAFRRGEDFTTLGQAFLYAGATAIIATLWRIADDGAAAFAEEFYGALARAGRPAEALRTAQLATLAHARYSAPYYWASYQLTGAIR